MGGGAAAAEDDACSKLNDFAVCRSGAFVRGKTAEEVVRGRGAVSAGFEATAASKGEAAALEEPPIGEAAAEKLRGVEDLDSHLPPPSPVKRRAVAARKASFCFTSAMGDDGTRSEAIPGAELR